MKALILTAALFLSGCAVTPSAAWQTLNVIDGAQTLHIARERCYYERDPLTRALIGRHPSEGQVVAVTALYGVAYHYGARWADRQRPAVRRTFYAVTIGAKVLTVANNHRIGLRPLGRGCR